MYIVNINSENENLLTNGYLIFCHIYFFELNDLHSHFFHYRNL